MKIAFALATVACAVSTMAHDVKSFTHGFYYTTTDPHNLPKLGNLTPKQQLKFTGRIIVLSGNNSNYYEFGEGRRVHFVTEDKIFRDLKPSFASFLKQNQGKDIRVGSPGPIRYILPEDAGKLANFSGTLVTKVDIFLSQIFLFSKGKVVASYVSNTMFNMPPRVIPIKKH